MSEKYPRVENPQSVIPHVISEALRSTTAEILTVREVPGATRQTVRLAGSTARCPPVETRLRLVSGTH